MLHTVDHRYLRVYQQTSQTHYNQNNLSMTLFSLVCDIAKQAIAMCILIQHYTVHNERFDT